jgi:hypothetical protein
MKMNKHYTVVPVSSGRVHKHTESFARQIVNTLKSDKTPEKTRRALRRTLQRLFDTTDIGKRRSLTKVENVALVLGCSGYQKIHEGREYMRAFKARIAMCNVIQAHERATNPYLIRLFARIAAERESESRPRAHRAERPRIAPVRRSLVAQQIAA